ncbi:MAG: hypothetical protein ACR2RD_09110 [Woeseiaceae bacterium]
MADDVRSLSKRSRIMWGLFCIALGCLPISIALGLFPVEPDTVMAPLWVVAGAGLVFVIAGIMILLAHYSRANDLLAGILCMLFGVMGTWVSLFSSRDGFSGGLFFLSYDQNVTIGRWVFGLGALISFSVAVYAFRRAAQSSR